MNKYTGVEVKTHTLKSLQYENKRIKKLVALGTYNIFAVLNNVKNT
jgi:hypothetical protein